jgi:glycosyltransferase involved in cell wall biosynthesis
MPVFNAEQFVAEALTSVLVQTYRDLNVIVVDDGSTDRTVELVEGIARRDPRVELIRNEGIKGVVGALNTGLRHATGEFVARMDGDDVSLANRFAAQLAFLKAHPDVALCGSWVKTFGSNPGRIWRLPVEHEDIRAMMLFCGAIAHPSVMLRRQAFSALNLEYDQEFAWAEDFDLWERAARQLRFGNVAQILLRYRTHADNVGTKNAIAQQHNTKRVLRRQIEQLGIQPTEAEFELHWRLSSSRLDSSDSFVAQSKAWLDRILEANDRTRIYEPNALAGYLAHLTNNIRAYPRPYPSGGLRRMVARGRSLLRRGPGYLARAMRSFRNRILLRLGPEASDRIRHMAKVLTDRNRIRPLLDVTIPSALLLPALRGVHSLNQRRRWRPQIALRREVPQNCRIGIAVLVHERPEYLDACLDTLFQTNLHDHDVTFLLIDDGSRDPRVRQLMERPRDPSYKIVRRFMPKGPSNAGAAINRALKVLGDVGSFDIVGWSDPDALYHPEWLDTMLKVCLWARANHEWDVLGPFCCFNSSDEDFHRVIATHESPYGKYVVKHQMGMLNYFCFAADLEELGLFDESPDDETLMTRRLDRYGVRNFCTRTSYAEHIGQNSVLNKWRPTPVERAVFGLHLASAGWPEQLAHVESIGYYRDVKGSSTVGAEAESEVRLDVVYVVADADGGTLPVSVESVRRNLRHPIGDIFLISPRDSELETLARRLGCRYVREEEVLELRKSDIQYRDTAWDRSGWLFQQILKLGADSLVGTERFFVLDGDTILLKPQIVARHDSDLLLHTEHYHGPYIDAYRRLTRLEPKTRITSVAHQMLFNRARLAALKQRIEAVNGTSWSDAIITAADLSEHSGFSEYESYGQWCIATAGAQTLREFAFNLALPRRRLASLDELERGYADRHRSASFHWYHR